MKYLVALEVGGTMEKPGYEYQHIQTIEAESEAEAIAKYNAFNNCSYYYGAIVGNETTGQTVFDTPATNSFS